MHSCQNTIFLLCIFEIGQLFLPHFFSFSFLSLEITLVEAFEIKGLWSISIRSHHLLEISVCHLTRSLALLLYHMLSKEEKHVSSENHSSAASCVLSWDHLEEPVSKRKW